MSIARQSKTFLKRLVGKISRQVDGFICVTVSTRVLESMTLKHVIIATLLLPKQGGSPTFLFEVEILMARLMHSIEAGSEV